MIVHRETEVRPGRSGGAAPAVCLTDVTMRYPLPKRYREMLLSPWKRRYVTVLREVCLTIMSGQTLGILGPNGAGKTTLLKLIGGLLYPHAGTIAVGGCDTQRANNQVRRKVGFVLNEDRSFYWRLTGRQNLEFFGALDNMTGKTLQRRSERLLDLVGLKDAAATRVSDYSCGMRQRLAIARGLLAEPEVLILDEPTRSLDPVGAESLRALIAGDVRSGGARTLVIATHQIEEARQLCDAVAILSSGRLVDWVSVEQARHGCDGLAGHYRRAVCPKEALEC